MDGMREIKCEYPTWKRERELQEQADAARCEAVLCKNELNKAKAVIVGVVVLAGVLAILLLAMVIVNSKENTAAKATAAILTEYEKEFKAEVGTAERIEVAAEVERVFKGVDLDDLPEKNAEFLEACRMITKQLGGSANNEK